MKKLILFIVDSWRLVMDNRYNPLRHIADPSLQTYFTLVLFVMWSVYFGFVASFYMGWLGYSTLTSIIVHIAVILPVAFTNAAVGKTDTDTSNSGSVTLDFDANQNFVLTLTGNVTLANPTTEKVGQSGFIAFIQDGTGSRTLTLGTDYESAGGSGITLTTTASATDLVPYVIVAANRVLLGTPQLAFS